MSKQVWICETCHSLWKDEAAAKACEAKHPPLEKFKLKRVFFYDKPFAARHERDVPDEVTIELPRRSPLDGWDYARYKLDHIGPKGC